jgi:GNAT superfamily N-acetyltransferase
VTGARLQIERFASAADFLRAAGPWLLAREADCSGVLSIVHLLTTDDHPFQEPFYLAAVKSAGQIVGCAVRPPPDQLDLTTMPRGAAALLTGGIAETYPDLKMVAGPPAAAREFARAWVRLSGGDWRIRHRWTLLALDGAVRALPSVPGFLRAATDEDLPIVHEWARGYGQETNSHVDVAAFYERRLRRRSLYIWDDEGARCMVAEANRTPNSVSISGVYTPSEIRNRGYASSAVAAATQNALDRGCKFCALFADSELATPINIYRKVGYRRLRDHVYVDLS